MPKSSSAARRAQARAVAAGLNVKYTEALRRLDNPNDPGGPQDPAAADGPGTTATALPPSDADVERWETIVAQIQASATDPAARILGDSPSYWHLVVPAGDAETPFGRWLTERGLMAETAEGPALRVSCSWREASAFAMHLSRHFTSVMVSHESRTGR